MSEKPEKTQKPKAVDTPPKNRPARRRLKNLWRAGGRLTSLKSFARNIYGKEPVAFDWLRNKGQLPDLKK